MKNTSPQTPGSALYETSGLVSQYLGFHYGPPVLEIPNFPAACISFLMDSIEFEYRERCLDVGCAVGRSSFELAKYFEHVDAIDLCPPESSHPEGVQRGVAPPSKEADVRFVEELPLFSLD